MIQVECHDSIHQVPADWDTLLDGRTLMQSRAAWTLFEESRLNDIRCHYLMARDDRGRLLGCATAYTIVTDIAIFAPPALRALLSVVRRLWPGFLRFRLLECGTPVTLNAPFHLAADAPAEAVIESLDRTLRRLARRTRSLAIVIRDFEPPERPRLEALARRGYHVIPNLPNTRLAIRWDTPEDYQRAMRSYYRSKLRRMLRKNRDNGIHYRLCTDFADLSEHLAVQWTTVSAQADEYQRERLTPGFFRKFAQAFGKHASILQFFRDGHWIAHALLLADGDCLRWVYFGRDRPANDGLYIQVAYAVIETAISWKMKEVEMGTTTYDIKKDLGARMIPIQMALHVPWPLCHRPAGWIYRLLNAPPPIDQRPVFKGGHDTRT